VEKEEGGHLSGGALQGGVAEQGLVHQPRHEKRGQEAGLLPRPRAQWVVHCRPEDGGHREVPPPAPEVAQRRRKVRLDELGLHLHIQRRAAAGRGTGEEDLYGEPEPDPVQREAHVEMQPVEEPVEMGHGGYGDHLERARNDRRRRQQRLVFVGTTAAVACCDELHGESYSQEEVENG